VQQVAGNILSQDKLNDSVASNGGYIKSEPDHDSNIQFDAKAFLDEVNCLLLKIKNLMRTYFNTFCF